MVVNGVTITDISGNSSVPTGTEKAPVSDLIKRSGKQRLIS